MTESRRGPGRVRPSFRSRVGLLRRVETFRTVADFTFDWEIWVAPSGRFRYVSPSCERITGHPASAFLADPAFLPALIREEDRLRWLETMDRSRADRAESVDFRLRRADGAEVWLSQETTRVLNPSGRWRGLRLSLRDVTDRVAAQEALRAAHEQLEARVLERTAELDAANRDLRREIARGLRVRKRLELSREQLRRLSAHIQDRIEDDRTRIAREIHDELGQNLTALNMGLARMERTLDRDRQELTDRIAGLKGLVAETVAAVQRISRELRPNLLDHLGLVEAAAWLVRHFSEESGIRAAMDMPEDFPALGRGPSTALYRVLQEALTNIARHSGAGRVEVVLERRKDQVLLLVLDDGRGVPEEALKDSRSFGLIGMQERLRFHGGSVRVRRRQEGGTEVEASLPVRARRPR